MLNKGTEETNKQITQWVNEFSDELFAFAYSRVSDRDLAKDLVQDTFFSALKAIDSFQRKSTPKTWLYKILKNKIIDYYRSSFYKKTIKAKSIQPPEDNRIQTPLLSKWNNVEDSLQSQEFFTQFNSCIEKLNEKQRTVFTMKYLDDLESEEICKKLQITTSNYWVIVHRAKLKLKECLDKHWFTDNQKWLKKTKK